MAIQDRRYKETENLIRISPNLQKKTFTYMTFLKTLSKSIFTEQTAQNIFTFWKKLLHYKKPIQLVKVDFSKPWWKPIWDAKSGFILPQTKFIREFRIFTECRFGEANQHKLLPCKAEMK